MNSPLAWVVTIISIVLSNYLIAQEQLPNNFHQIIVKAAGLEFDSDIDGEIYETLLEHFQNPVNLNIASYEQLKSLLVLSEFQINQLLSHIEKYGPLYSVYELQSIPGFDARTISNLLSFSEIKEKNITVGYWKGYFLFRMHRFIQKKEGFGSENIDHKFLGSPYSSLIKIRLNKSKDIALGLTLENDIGEPILWAKESEWYGTGFQSGYLQIQDKGIVKNIIVGDFSANWGQGLVFGGGFSMGKGRQSTAVHKNVSTGLSPYRSTLEQGFLRGAGITIKSGMMELSTIISKVKLDANVNESEQITSTITNGLHRTSFEQSKRKIVAESSTGINIQFNPKTNRLLTGVSSIYTEYDRDFSPIKGSENKFKFAGKSNLVSSGYLEYRRRNYILFGEGALNLTGSKGFILGGLASLSQNIEALFSYRNYSPDFVSFYARNAFRESSSPQNERGFYTGIKYVQSKKLVISTYADIYRFPWLKRSILSPSNGSDLMISAEFFPTEKLQLKAYYRNKQKERNYETDDGTNPIAAIQTKELVKIDAIFDITEEFSYSSGIWYSGSRIKETKNIGSLIYSGISYQGKNISMHLKAILTDVKDYETRFYMYESDVLYAFSVPVYYGQNIRYYLTIKTRITPKLSFWWKWASTNFRDREKIGSGVDLIRGHLKSEIKFQAIYKL